MGRWLAIDYGTRRIGLAICDPDEQLASPAGALTALGGAARDAALLLEWARKNDVAGFVVGLPLNMDGTIGPQARMSQALVRELKSRSPLPVHEWDERLSSFQADQWLAEQGDTHPQPGRRDALAALAILRSFMESRNA